MRVSPSCTFYQIREMLAARKIHFFIWYVMYVTDCLRVCTLVCVRVCMHVFNNECSSCFVASVFCAVCCFIDSTGRDEEDEDDDEDEDDGEEAHAQPEEDVDDDE